MYILGFFSGGGGDACGCVFWDGGGGGLGGSNPCENCEKKEL